MKIKWKRSGLESENVSTKYGKERKKERMNNKLGINKKKETDHTHLNKLIKTLPC